MKQCELERVIKEKGNPKLKRTGEKLISFIKGVKTCSEGSIIELKKTKGLWVIDKIHDQDIVMHQLKRNWSVDSVEK